MLIFIYLKVSREASAKNNLKKPIPMQCIQHENSIFNTKCNLYNAFSQSYFIRNKIAIEKHTYYNDVLWLEAKSVYGKLHHRVYGVLLFSWERSPGGTTKTFVGKKNLMLFNSM